MVLSLNKTKLAQYISDQVNFLFPDHNKINLSNYTSSFDLALARLEYCFSKIVMSRYNNNDQIYYNHIYSDQHLMLLWFISNQIWKDHNDLNTCNKLYYLNKSLHSFDCNFNTELPEIFIVIHGVGTVLGKAKYSDYLVVYQGVTVGMNKNRYPIIGKGVSLTSNSSIIGDCDIGDYVNIGSGITLIDKKIVPNSNVYRNDIGLLNLRPTTNIYCKKYFHLV